MKLTQTRRKILKYLFGLGVLVMFTGPVLICIGIALMVIPSERADNIADYNAALGSYDTTGIDTWGQNGANVNTVALATESRRVEINGELDDVKFYNAEVATASVAANTQLQFAIPDAGLSFTRNGVPASKTRLSSAVCQNANGCTLTEMQTYCTNEFAGTYTGTGPCKSAGLCYECSHLVYLTEYCAVLKETATAGTYIEDPDYPSCYFPFTANSQRFDSYPAPAAVIVTLRKSNDPFLALQRITEGRMDFGSKVIHERMAGYGLLVAGILMTCILLFMIYMLLSTHSEILEEEEEAEARRIKIGGSHASSPATNTAAQ